MIEQVWSRIQPDVKCGNTRTEVVAEGFLYPWNHDNANMNMIQKFFSFHKPKIVLELGTFEGYGTSKIAKAMQENGGEVVYTFDVGTNPVNTLGPTYGVPEGEFLVDWQNIKGWESFGKVIQKRKENLGRSYGRVKVNFVEGESAKTLPTVLDTLDHVDFIFHDTIHTIDYILKEWILLKPKMKTGSVIVFDDIVENSPEHLWFVQNESKDFKIIHTKIGHQQLWMERLSDEGDTVKVEIKTDTSNQFRYMCLACGRFWTVYEKLQATKSICPHCGDLYFADNIIPNKPEPIDSGKVRFMCGHEFLIETGDVNFCTHCGETKLESKQINKTLVGYQNDLLGELGL